MTQGERDLQMMAQELAEAPEKAVERVLGREQISSKILKSAFLIAFGKYGTVTKAREEVARELGVMPSRLRIMHWTKKDHRFRSQLVMASEEAADRLEEAARERAVDGWEEPVYFKGELMGSVRRYSDSLLQMLLKGAKPGKYRDVVGVQYETARERKEALNKEMARLSLMPAPVAEDAQIVAGAPAPTE